MKVKDLLQFYNARYSKRDLFVNMTMFNKNTLQQEPYKGAKAKELTDEDLELEVVDFDIHLNGLWLAVARKGE